MSKVWWQWQRFTSSSIRNAATWNGQQWQVAVSLRSVLRTRICYNRRHRRRITMANQILYYEVPSVHTLDMAPTLARCWIIRV